MSEVSRPIALPLHRQLRDLMIARIDSGEWSPGTYLPSETRLAEEYGVSVGTLRKALLDLAQEGIVARRQGKGTVVTTHNSDAVLFRFFNLRRPDGSTLHPESRVLARRRRRATPAEAEALGLDSGASVIAIERVREADGVPIIHEVIALDGNRFAGLEHEPELLPNTLYQLYQLRFGATVHRAHERLTAEAVPAARAGELGLAAGDPVLRIARVAVDFSGKPLEYRASWVNTRSLHYQTAV
jgi:GntR family transcriptional regulator